MIETPNLNYSLFIQLVALSAKTQRGNRSKLGDYLTADNKGKVNT